MTDQRKKRLRTDGMPEASGDKKNWRIEREPGLLIVHFENTDGTKTKVNLTSWLSIGPLAEDFATAFAITQAPNKQAGRYAAAGSFKQAGLKYFTSREKRFSTPGEVPADFITEIAQTLKKPHPITGKYLADNTVVHYLKAVVLLVPGLKQIGPQWSHIEAPKYATHGTKSSSPTKNIDSEGMTETLLVAARDSLRLMNELWPRLAKVRKAHADMNAGKHVPLNSPEKKVARVLFDNGGNFPTPSWLGQNAGDWSKDEKTYQSYRNLAYPLGGELIPLYLMLLSQTGWNAQVMNCLAIGGIQFNSLFGSQRICLQSTKHRGGSRGRPGSSSTIRWAATFSENALSANNIIRFLLDWTMLLREYATDPLSNDLFLHAVAAGGNNLVAGLRIDSYAARFDNETTRITNYVVKYCKGRNVRYCGSRSLRLGMAELIDTATNGDALQLKNLLGHRLIDTGQDHYRTSAMLQRSSENMAGGIAVHQRWITSRGKVDTRSKPEGRNSTAATPGFTCLDAFNSPIVGQVEGRLCTAYGMCPSCPLASSDPDQPYAFARALQLKEEFERAKERLGEGIWKLKYQKQHRVLVSRWIPALDVPENRHAATLVTLSALPSLE